MKLTYIYHSGFAIETDKIIILIDYYKDTESDEHGYVHDRLLKQNKKIYILSTHSHHDHFNPQILRWKENRPDLQYIFSFDIRDTKLANESDAVYLNKLETYHDESIQIKAFGSTDLGISFLIKCEGKSIFHAGDLNNWHWNEESTEQEAKEAENFYLTELKLLTQEVSHLDLVMFPVDARLGKDYMRGAEQFLEKIDVKVFAPMHFGEQYDTANAFEALAKQLNTDFFRIENKGNNIIF